jgi:2-polyprenyl-3-methyl-5-hydroxy-6-metoxy-1,4-benzoquinol methylase
MTTTIDFPQPPAPGDEVDAFAERVFAAVLGAQQVQAIELGARLGWYDALAAGGAMTSGELAAATSSNERYAREWLEHQAVCGYVTVDSAAAAAGERRYLLPPAHAAVLADADSVAYMTPIARFVAGTGRFVDRIAAAYRSGGGLSWDDLGDDAREAQAAANRPLFLHRLGQELLPAAPALHKRLGSGPVRIADVGCGYGWSAIGLARTYPEAVVDGYDVDAPSVSAARRNAEAAGVADRVSFHVADVGTLSDAAVAGGYDVVFAFECVHDLPDPVAVLAAMRRLVVPGGPVVVMDERTEEQFTAPAGEVEQLLYGYSLMCCLGDCMSHQPSAETGTVMRPATLAEYAREAGYSDFGVLPIEDDFFRFYELSAG